MLPKALPLRLAIPTQVAGDLLPGPRHSASALGLGAWETQEARGVLLISNVGYGKKGPESFFFFSFFFFLKKEFGLWVMAKSAAIRKTNGGIGGIRWVNLEEGN